MLETALLFANCKKAMLGETRTLNFGKEKISLNLEQGDVEEQNNRTVAMTSLLEERKLPKKERKGYNRIGGTQQLRSTVKKQNQSMYVIGSQKC